MDTRRPGETVSEAEFVEHWKELIANLSTRGLEPEQVKARSVRTWNYFSRMRAGVWKRTVDYYIENAGEEPWFPTLGQLIVALERSAPPAETVDDGLTPEEKARLRKETEEWAAGLDLNSIGHGIS